MKIVVTGCDGALGRNICNILLPDHTVMCLNEKDDNSVNNVIDLIGDYDVFINCGYKEKVQSTLFEKVFTHWKYENKTIINILTSALVFDGPNKSYMENKRHLEKLTFDLRSGDKKVRVINIYPNTLESRKSSPYNTLKLDDVSNTIKWVLSLPQEIEIFQLGISKTTTDLGKTLL
jgi:NAD(P)-dependent dehydrogenase (short-subunit alcohol dehydrogenase family)